MPTITPNLWFDSEGLEAAEFYISLFPNSEITNVSHYGDGGPRPAGSVLTVDFVLDGQHFTALNGGPEYQFSEAISMLISCADQDEVDYYWNRLAEGGQEVACGWVKDRYGLFWQVVPAVLPDMIADPDPEKARRVNEAMFTMTKLDIAALQKAYAGG